MKEHPYHMVRKRLKPGFKQFICRNEEVTNEHQEQDFTRNHTAHVLERYYIQRGILVLHEELYRATGGPSGSCCRGKRIKLYQRQDGA
jgi:hypothetical protein